MIEKQNTNGNKKAEATRTAANRAIATQSNIDVTVSTGAVQNGHGEVDMELGYHYICSEVLRDMSIPAQALKLYVLLLRMSDIRNGETPQIYIRELANKYGRSERTTQKWLAYLIDRGLVECIPHSRDCNSFVIVHSRDRKLYAEDEGQVR